MSNKRSRGSATLHTRLEKTAPFLCLGHCPGPAQPHFSPRAQTPWPGLLALNQKPYVQEAKRRCALRSPLGWIPPCWHLRGPHRNGLSGSRALLRRANASARRRYRCGSQRGRSEGRGRALAPRTIFSSVSRSDCRPTRGRGSDHQRTAP